MKTLLLNISKHQGHGNGFIEIPLIELIARQGERIKVILISTDEVEGMSRHYASEIRTELMASCKGACFTFRMLELTSHMTRAESNSALVRLIGMIDYGTELFVDMTYGTCQGLMLDAIHHAEKYQSAKVREIIIDGEICTTFDVEHI